MATKLPSSIRDTTEFLTRIRKLRKLPKDCYLVTQDVSSLCTNIDTQEGLKITKEQFHKLGQNNPSAETITGCLENVLTLNDFTFNKNNYLQVKGTSRVSN